jgi:hypothetical protein
LSSPSSRQESDLDTETAATVGSDPAPQTLTPSPRQPPPISTPYPSLSAPEHHREHATTPSESSPISPQTPRALAKQSHAAATPFTLPPPP